MLDVTDFSLIDVDELTNEYKEVADDFKLKMGTLEVIHIKVLSLFILKYFKSLVTSSSRNRMTSFNYGFVFLPLLDSQQMVVCLFDCRFVD